MFSKFCFSRFHGKFQLSQCCFSVFNFRRTTIKFLFLRFHCQIPIFTLPLSKFQFFTLLLAGFNFHASALKTCGGNNCLFSNWICLRNHRRNLPPTFPRLASVANLGTEYFPLRKYFLRNVNVNLPQNSQLRQTCVSRSVFYLVTFQF